MSSFYRRGLLSPDADSSVQSARTIEATTPSVNLPPLRSIDSLQRLATYPPGPSLPGQEPSAGLPPIKRHHPSLPSISQYHNNFAPASSLGNYDDSGDSGVQMNSLLHPTFLPIAPSGSYRLISGGRPKKEVKRRTKTGCLTCRKRRIKVSHLPIAFKGGSQLSM